MIDDTMKERDKITERRTPGNRWFWLSILFDALLFIATCTYAYVAYHQWKVMNNQANLMSQQLESTKRSIEQTQEMLGYARQQASASNIQTEIAKESERPYIVIKEIALSNVSVKARPNYVVVYENSGRTTARHLTIKVVIELRSSPLPENPAYPAVSGVASVFDLGAGAQGSNSSTSTLVLTASDIEAIKLERAWLYVYGTGEYTDGHGERHGMKFCAYYEPTTRGSKFCGQHNGST